MSRTEVIQRIGVFGLRGAEGWSVLIASDGECSGSLRCLNCNFVGAMRNKKEGSSDGKQDEIYLLDGQHH